MKSKTKRILLILSILALGTVLTGCIPGDGTYTRTDPAGFFWGIWHGWFAPISLVIGLFDKNIHIYEIFNTGWWYDFGFYMAIISGFGGISISRKKKKKKND